MAVEQQTRCWVRHRVDDLGVAAAIPDEVARVVSLVPSLTESVAATRSDALVAATSWCTHPADLRVERVRGTKNPDVRRIIALRPDLVLANQEENRRRDVDLLRAAGIPVWVTVTKSVPGAIASLQRVFTDALGWGEPTWLSRCRDLWRGDVPAPTQQVVIAVWRDPWMVVGRDTFAGDLVARLGSANAFAGAAQRYPRVTPADIIAREPDLVVLPDEPYRFTADDGPEAFPARRTTLISGRHLTWYGPSLLDARDALGHLAADAIGEQ